MSALLRKSITDLTRRKARTFFTVATLALAVASFGFFAIPSLIDASMQEEVRAGRLADVVVSMRPLTLDAEQLAELAALPNVAAVEPRSSLETRVLVGERRAPARLIGVGTSRASTSTSCGSTPGRSPPRARSPPKCRMRTSASSTSAPVTR